MFKKYFRIISGMAVLAFVLTGVLGVYLFSKFNDNNNQLTAQAAGILGLDPSQTYQTIEGMGGFGPSQPWWNSNDPNVFFNESWIQKLEGMGVSVIREQISPSFESTNDNSDPNNLNLNAFNADSETKDKRIPYLKRITQAGIKIIASTWSAPGWLKVNGEIDESCPANNQYCSNANHEGPNRSTNRLKDDPTSLAEFAERMVGYIRLMESNGVPIYGLSIANEPMFNQWYESSSYDPTLYAKAFNAVATRFAQENITTKLFGIENMVSEWFRTKTESFLDKLQADYPQSMAKLHAIAVHGYASDGITGNPGSASDFAGHKTLGQKYGGKRVWMTETSNSGDGEWASTAYPTAKGMIGALRDGDLSLSTWWYWDNGVFDGNLNPKKLFYSLKQFYTYLKPGDIRIGATSPYPDVSSVAFKSADNQNPKLIFVNDSNQIRNIDFTGLSADLPKSYSGFYTDASNNYSPISGNNTINLPPQSIVSVQANLTGGGSGGTTGGGGGSGGTTGGGGGGGTTQTSPLYAYGKTSLTPKQGSTAPNFRDQGNVNISFNNFSNWKDLTPANGNYKCTIAVRPFQDTDSTGAWTVLLNQGNYDVVNGCSTAFTKANRGNILSWSIRVTIENPLDATKNGIFDSSYIFQFKGSGVAFGS